MSSPVLPAKAARLQGDRDGTRKNTDRKTEKFDSKATRKGRRNQVSINHLLEFPLYRDLPEYRKERQKPRRQSYGRQRPKFHLHGMSFVNVNYRFIVDGRKPYKLQKLDPNVPVDVEDIMLVIVPKGNACPICLSEELVAPRMITLCGHILCLACLLTLLHSEVPVHKKSESKLVTETYKDCPLCGVVIRQKDIKPVLIEHIDERFDVPKVHDDAILTLMARPANSTLALPLKFAAPNDFPWTYTPETAQYLHYVRGDLAYVTQMYEGEKTAILASHESDRAMYDTDDKYVNMAIEKIDADLALWSSKLVDDTDHDVSFDATQPTFYHYQTGSGTATVYVLSPLDVKVLKHSFVTYEELPNVVVAPIENIRFEELTQELAMSKYKHLSHLPLGTSIGFLECNWRGHPLVREETWAAFAGELTKRSKASARKLKLEEQNRVRAQTEEERRAWEVVEQETRQVEVHSSLSTLTLGDYTNLPALSSASASLEEQVNHEYQQTIWGTQVLKSEQQKAEELESQEMIARAKAKKGRKGKVVLMSL